ncbi:anamorsin homolog 2-like isoform X1 [Malus sylvestris]|uniref:anamorsin homolog 2-like isoform X1 n=1 Tax=Malus sylvestris TaxID=3752 RepID=UPI0021ABA397|nr:anamorsin homolog 2-like isoform X1 [Malus sylvestris]
MANPASIKPVDLPKIELEDDGLIDEDSLLTEEDRKRPDLPVAVTIPSKPPCKKVEMCGLGDAFRCSACPVKGIPPFILDEKAGCAVDFTDFERHCDFDRCKQEDAFRCSACPFKGLPSLETGNKRTRQLEWLVPSVE